MVLFDPILKLSPARDPIAVLDAEAGVKNKVRLPTAVLSCPAAPTFADSAASPRAVFPDPAVFCSSALWPTAVFTLPVVLLKSEFSPTAVF
jgi:hypothetical protein